MKEETTTVAKKKKKKVKQRRLMINVAHSKYYVVRYVAKKMFNMKLSYNYDEDWDICWTDGAVSCDKLYKMKGY